MFDAMQLATFVAVVATMVIVPGPNTVLILGNSAGGGRAAGVATVLGIETGTAVHTLAAGLGLSTLLANSALAFDVVKYVGAGYLAFLGVAALIRCGDTGPQTAAATRRQLARIYARAMVTNLLNPKVAVFFLALLPQFVDPSRGHVVLQIAALGGIVSAIGLTCGLALAFAAGAAERWLRREGPARWQARLSGALMLALSARLALGERC